MLAQHPTHLPLFNRLRRVFTYFEGSHWAALFLLAALCLLALTEPAIPAMLKSLLDRGFAAGSLPIWVVAAALMSLFAVRGVASFCADYLMTYLAFGAMYLFRKTLFDKLLVAQFSIFAAHSASSLANVLVFEVQNGMQQLVSLVGSLLRNGMMLIAMLGYLLYLNWQLTLIILTILPTVAWVMRTLSKRMHRIVKATQIATDEMAYVVEENVAAQKIVRLHHAAEQQRRRFDTFSLGLRRLALKSTTASAAMTPLTQMLAASALTIVVSIALWQVQHTPAASATTTVGGFVAFITAMLMLIAPIKHVSESIGPLTRGLAALERGLDLLDHTPNERSGSHTQDRVRGEIELRDVSLTYDGQERAAIDRINLHIRAGEIIALVGASGSGKTSLVNLLPRFIEPSLGEIAIDGMALPNWNLDNLRSHFAYVSQDVIMFNDTLANNITLGDDTPDATRLASAVKGAYLEDLISQLPEGLNSLCGHNANQLSGGQRQRLAIARALYKDAPILLLDEATSALDNESERAVQAALQVLMQGRTTIIVAHRLSTILHADRIVVLTHGKIVEMGTHQELLAKDEHYAHLYNLTQSAQYRVTPSSSFSSTRP